MCGLEREDEPAGQICSSGTFSPGNDRKQEDGKLVKGRENPGFDSSQLSCDTRQARRRNGTAVTMSESLVIKFWNWEEYFQQTCPNTHVSTDPF